MSLVTHANSAETTTMPAVTRYAQVVPHASCSKTNSVYARCRPSVIAYGAAVVITAAIIAADIVLILNVPLALGQKVDAISSLIAALDAVFVLICIVYTLID